MLPLFSMLKAQSAILLTLKKLEEQVDRHALKGPPVYAIVTYTSTTEKQTNKK